MEILSNLLVIIIILCCPTNIMARGINTLYLISFYSLNLLQKNQMKISSIVKKYPV